VAAAGAPVDPRHARASRSGVGAVRFVGLRGDQRAAYAAPLAAIDAEARYPLGDDTFTLDHGEDYFAFFDRLGEEERWVVLDENEVAATASGVLRTLDDGPAWYLCDLKVRGPYRERHLPTRLGLRAAPAGLLRCRRGYGIAMDPPGASGASHPMARRLGRLSLFKAAVLGHLTLFVLDAAEATALTPTIEAHRGPVSWLSLAGVKDVVLESTGAPMPLLHAQFGPYAERGGDVREGGVHMVCAPSDDALGAALAREGLPVSGTATVFHLGMDAGFLPAILSSDI
jgi:hypothetical protein